MRCHAPARPPLPERRGGRWTGPRAPTGGSARRIARALARGPHRLLLLTLAACATPAVRWVTEPRALAGPLADDAVIVLRGLPDRVRAIATSVPAPAKGLPALGAGACLSSVRWARATVPAGHIAAAWWAARRDSSVVLRLARSADDGAHWDTTRSADDRDRGLRGCARPPPSVSFDPASGYTHLAYFLEPASGAGVFYEHLMDAGPPSAVASPPGTVAGAAPAAMFHAPVAIVFGETPARASVASHGDTVVVAYEDPNRAAPQVDVAVSLTAGHTFASRDPVSGDDVAARDPAAAVQGAIVGVAWRQSGVRAEGSAAPVPDAQAMVRLGTLK